MHIWSTRLLYKLLLNFVFQFINFGIDKMTKFNWIDGCQTNHKTDCHLSCYIFGFVYGIVGVCLFLDAFHYSTIPAIHWIYFIIVSNVLKISHTMNWRWHWHKRQFQNGYLALIHWSIEILLHETHSFNELKILWNEIQKVK